MLRGDDTKLTKVPVSGIQIGMYVAKLDKDWLDSSFLYQGFMIESLEDINLLEQECEFVWVEPVDELGGSKKRDSLEVLKPSNKKRRYINKVSMPKEYERSHSAFKASRQRTKTILNDIALNGIINTVEAKKTVDSCLESVLRNPSAMLWMTRVREENSYTADHSLNVCVLAIAFGRQLNFSEEELFSLGMSGLLHDVGKLRIPEAVINKPGKLSSKEWKQMQAHVTLGRNLLMTTPDIGQSVDVAYTHHERIDGKGYPRGLNGSQISQFAKIISIVDSFDAMMAKRSYSEAMTPTAAVKEIYRGRGSQFDELLALEFIRTIGLYPPGTVVELANGSLGIVLERNLQFQHLPKVLLLKDKSFNSIRKKLIDLSEINEGKLDKSFLIKADHPDGYQDISVAENQHFIISLS